MGMHNTSHCTPPPPRAYLPRSTCHSFGWRLQRGAHLRLHGLAAFNHTRFTAHSLPTTPIPAGLLRAPTGCTLHYTAHRALSFGQKAPARDFTYRQTTRRSSPDAEHGDWTGSSRGCGATGRAPHRYYRVRMTTHLLDGRHLCATFAVPVRRRGKPTVLRCTCRTTAPGGTHSDYRNMLLARS